MSRPNSMANLTVVLYEPQDDINIGSVVRVCANFGIDDIRLVRPRVGDVDRVAISAPNARERVERLQRFESLDDALAGVTRVFGATARSRSAASLVADPVQAAQEVCSTPGNVALMFGREDHGLPNEALDRCDVTVTIPTSPDYASLNLAQAVLVLVWEVFRAANLGVTSVAERPSLRSHHDLAPREQTERMFAEAREALDAIEFFKYGDGEHVMRSVRNVLLRAGLDRREQAIWFGIFKEIRAYILRTGRDQSE